MIKNFVMYEELHRICDEKWVICRHKTHPSSILKGTQLAHMCIGYHFISNLHLTETRSTLFSTKYDKNNIIGWAEAHSKTGFSVNDWKSSKTLRGLKRNSRCTLISGWGELRLFKVRKLVSRSARSHCCLCSFNHPCSFMVCYYLFGVFIS